MRMTDDEIERMLRTLDPAGQPSTAARTVPDPATIRATATAASSRPGPWHRPAARRRLVLAGAGVAALGLTGAVLNERGCASGPTGTARPPTPRPHVP